MSMIKIEAHCHSFGGSYCALCTNEEIVKTYQSLGYGGVVLTNHYSISQVQNEYAGLSDSQRVDAFFALYESLKSCGEKVGFKVFYGIEVRCVPTETEYMVIGFDKKFLYDNPNLHLLSQEQLFKLCQNENAFMYQTHPFRAGVKCGNPKYMHGAECFNGHFHHVNYNAVANDFCEKNNLIKMYGTDFHENDQPVTSFMYIPDSIADSVQLGQYFLSGKATGGGDDVYYELELKKYREAMGRCK